MEVTRQITLTLTLSCQGTGQHAIDVACDRLLDDIIRGAKLEARRAPPIHDPMSSDPHAERATEASVTIVRVQP